jgi:hypothetical protein
LHIHQFSRPVNGRTLYGGQAPSVAALATELIRPSENFVLFIAVDACALPGRTLAAVARTVLGAGASFLCCWGPECSRFHGQLSDADRAVHGDDDCIIMTACRQGEALEQALWYAVHVAQPSPRFAASTHSVVAVAIANPGWASQIETFLAAGAPLPDEA